MKKPNFLLRGLVIATLGTLAMSASAQLQTETTTQRLPQTSGTASDPGSTAGTADSTRRGGTKMAPIGRDCIEMSDAGLANCQARGRGGSQAEGAGTAGSPTTRESSNGRTSTGPADMNEDSTRGGTERNVSPESGSTLSGAARGASGGTERGGISGTGTTGVGTNAGANAGNGTTENTGSSVSNGTSLGGRNGGTGGNGSGASGGAGDAGGGDK